MQSDASASGTGTHWIADRLDVRLGQGRMAGEQLAGIAEALAAVHAAPAPATGSGALLARGAEARAGVASLAPALAEAAASCEAAHAAAIRAAGDAWEARIAGAAARRLHGQLRCEDVHVDPFGHTRLGPPAEEAVGDPCEDVAALALRIAARGRADLARALIGAYAQASHDFGLYRVLDAHLALAALEAAQRTLAASPDAEAARAAAGQLLASRAQLAAPGTPPFVIAVAGAMASGKSTLAARLASTYAAPVASADAARPGGLSALEPDAQDAAYAEMLRRAAEVLASGRPVVLDACFPTRALRARAREFAAERRAPLLFVECRAEASLTRRRLEERARRQGLPASEWLALRERLLAGWQPLKELPREQHLLVDTARDVAPSLSRIERALGRSTSRPHRVRRHPRGASATA